MLPMEMIIAFDQGCCVSRKTLKDEWNAFNATSKFKLVRGKVTYMKAGVTQ